MATNDNIQRYIDAGIAFTNMTRKKAEELVSELVKNGDIQTDEAKARVEELLERGRQGTEVIVSHVRSEVSRQLDAVGITSLEDLANQVAALLGRSETSTKKKAAAKKAPAKKKAAAKKAPAKKKAAAKKAPATKKPAAKKAPATNKAPAKKAPATKAVPPTPPAAHGSAD